MTPQIAMRGCRPLTGEELRRVSAAFRGPWRLRNLALFIVGHRTGYRIQELLSLRVRDVLARGEVRPDGQVLPEDIAERVTVARRAMKGRRASRTVIVHPEARQAVADWLAEMGRRGLLALDAPLFCSRQRRPAADGARPLFAELAALPEDGRRRAIDPGQATRILKAAYRRAGVYGRVATHSMRKTFARRVYRASRGDLVTCQQALGHAQIGTTMSYLGAGQDDVDRAVLADVD